MKILLVEDESLAHERIKYIISKNFPDFEICSVVQSVEEFKIVLDSDVEFDIILCDIHLADGLSFHALKNHDITKPIIFITAYDEYALDSFDHYCIDYILKPVEEDRLVQAFRKFERLTKPVNSKGIESEVFNKILKKFTQKQYKKRFLTKVGNRFKFITTDHVACFFSQDGITYLMEMGSSQKFIIEHNLNELMNDHLDPFKFYRINRSAIIHLDSLIEMKPYSNGRLSLSLSMKNSKDTLVVAREKVSDFKNWINQ